MTTLTTGHAGVSGPRPPFSHTGPDGTTEKRNRLINKTSKRRKRKPGEERCTQAYKSVADVQTFRRTLPFIFMMIECQSVEEACKDFRFNCCHEKRERKKRLRSIPGYTPHSLSSGTILASLCLELSSTRFNRAQPNTIEMWKNHLIPDTAVFHYLETCYCCADTCISC